MTFMNNFLIGTTCLIIGRYIGRKDEDGRAAQPSRLKCRCFALFDNLYKSSNPL